jgi:hypothetical protein
MGPYASSNKGYTVAVGPWVVIPWAHPLAAGYIYKVDTMGRAHPLAADYIYR